MRNWYSGICPSKYILAFLSSKISRINHDRELSNRQLYLEESSQWMKDNKNIMMPNIDGYKLLNVLRSDVKTQLILVTLEISKIQGLDKGADDYLIKPFSNY
ncbi:hypothetical protein C2G38_2038489 [Gigaspora rosea]|uniref:Response regulatory domain-containing protein n=1 Tax=Gigaspora rosea TaxID=44941 RepID=A0A397V9B6_9GLOM|nr:hypothetical protein C2G38_2038489 [Gigaspora rosea]